MTYPEWLRAEPSGILGSLLGVLFPARCVSCGRAGHWFCSACTASIPGAGRLVVLSRLRAQSNALCGVLSLSSHVPPLREAVHGLKYGGMRVLADPLARLLAAGWQAWGRAVDVIVPVPLHPVQRRQRVYNQSELISRALADYTGLPVQLSALERIRHTRSQVGLPMESRLTNVTGAFACGSATVRGHRILLIDDVLTTGATLSACASALHEAGAGEIWGLTLTYAPDPGVAQDKGNVDSP